MRARWSVALAALAAPLAMSAGRALAADCGKMIDAVQKGDHVPKKIFSEQVTGDSPGTWQTIEVDGKRYRGQPGAWTVSKLDAQSETDQFKAIVSNYPDGCTLDGSEAVGGEMADIVTLHFNQSGLKADIRIWISQTRGLTLRMETRITGLGQDKFIRAAFDYDDVKAPPDAP